MSKRCLAVVRRRAWTHRVAPRRARTILRVRSTMIVPYPAGGVTGRASRGLFAERMKTSLGQTITIENVGWRGRQ